MKTMDKLIEIANRIEHMENAAEWIARETANTDAPVSQTGSLICVLCDDVRERICALVHEIEEFMDNSKFN